ncbi:tripartite tricarboxylate transporter permease [Elioraea sp.]|uniref:tripartite tricarboxylate transporter permease n=1 Tax=Elioraea sp. TaxID=2185103 RepID=UPI003F72F954
MMPDHLLMSWLDPALFAATALGTLAGIWIGAIPGLSVTMAVSILVSFTFAWPLEPALALMAGVFTGGVYGGSRSAILLNIPGGPAAIATALDGYPMAKRGDAGAAIGLTTLASFLGGLIGVAALALGAPAIAEVAILFAPRDYLLLAVLGLLLVGSLSGESLAKGLFAAGLGVTLGLVGLDPMTAEPRFTYGSVELLGGIPYIAAMIGFFGAAEALAQLRLPDAEKVRQRIGRIVPARATLLRHLPLALRCSGIGVVIGALPGTGGDIAALMAYDHARRSTRAPAHPFGSGAEEGVIAPEAANNAAVGGAYVPMLTLGIPGDAVTAVLIGALFVHGLKPGPMLMIETPHLFWFTVGNLLLANLALLAFGLAGARAFARVAEVPRAVLVPLILVLCVVGTFAIRNSLTDVWWMLGFGITGYGLRLYGFQPGPIILGMILGPLMDASWRRAVIAAGDDVLQAAADATQSVISLVLIATIALIALRSFFRGKGPLALSP